MRSQLPRFAQVSRRAFLQRSLVVGGVLVAGVPALACGNDDDAALGGDDEGDAGSSAPATGGTEPASGDTAPDGTTAGSTPPAAGDALPAGAQLQVSFTYTADGTGRRVRNPYIAVWVETPAGDLVQTVSLWYQARESKYLRELTGWYGAETTFLDGGGTDNVDEVSGATRAAGAYDVMWDGTAVDGSVVAQGDYVLFVESAREHGPHQLTSAALTLGTEGFSTALPDDGELSGLTATYVV